MRSEVWGQKNDGAESFSGAALDSPPRPYLLRALKDALNPAADFVGVYHLSGGDCNLVVPLDAIAKK